MAHLARILCAGLLATALFDAPGYADESAGPDTVEAVRLPEGATGLRDVALRLKARESAIDRRERTFDDRLEDLLAVEKRLETRLSDLATIRDQIALQLVQADEETLARRNGLVKMFEGMKSKDAAAVVSKLDADLATEVLDEMNRTKAGKVLAAMNPTTAARLAEKMVRPVILESP